MRLIEAARQVFAERGYPDATVDEIASEAGASRATFYLHFKSKAELASALVEDATPFAVERYRLLDELLASGGPSLRGRLRDWLSDWLDIWSQSVQASHALLQAAMLEPGVETQRLRQSEALVDALEGYFARLPETERGRARDRMLVLEIMTQRILSLLSASRLPIGHSEALDILTDMWLRVLADGQGQETALPLPPLVRRYDQRDTLVSRRCRAVGIDVTDDSAHSAQHCGDFRCFLPGQP
jgi:AcrR family transcriptional regulator